MIVGSLHYSIKHLEVNVVVVVVVIWQYICGSLNATQNQYN